MTTWSQERAGILLLEWSELTLSSEAIVHYTGFQG